MSSFIHKDGQPIESIEDWFRLAPPAGGLRQWKDGRSAKEAARRWLQGLPPEVAHTLDSHADLRGFSANAAEPEVETELDEFSRKRNHDLVVEGTGPQGKVLLCVEAKADETFDSTIKTRLENLRPDSNLPERIRRISMALFGHDRMELISALRYQLLQACAGSLIEARVRRKSICVFLVHVFRTRLTDDQRIADNAADLDRFVAQLSGGAFTSVPSNTVVGPITVPGYMTVSHFEHLYIAKATADLTMVRS